MMDDVQWRPDAPLARPPPRTWRSRTGMALLCLLMLAGIAAAIWLWPARTAQQSGRGNRDRDAPVPVVAATAEQTDVPVYLDALGTVQAFNTVTVRSQVDGALVEVPFQEGQHVKAGDVLAKIDPRTYQAAYDQQVAKKQQDLANLANARVDLARYQKLAATAYTSAQQADTQKAVVAQLEAQVAQDQALVDNAKVQLGYTTVTAPIEGRLGMRTVDPGNILHAGDTIGIVTITQLQPISVVFTLPQQDLPAVAAAMKQGKPEVLAFAQAGDRAAPLDRGELAVLDNQVDPATGTIKLKATFPNADEQLWPGAFVGIRLQTRVLHGVVTVPPAAVQRGPRGAFVYIVNADNSVTRRDVTPGHEDERATVIRDGVKSGETVVVDGASRLTDKSKVTVAGPTAEPAAPNPAAAPGALRSRRRAS